MKKLILLVTMFLFLAGSALASDFSNFDDEYCLNVEDVEYCMDFKWLPFGASGAMFYKATVTWEGYWQSNPVSGQSDVGTVTSYDGKRFEFNEIPFIGIFERGKLRLLEQFADLERK